MAPVTRSQTLRANLGTNLPALASGIQKKQFQCIICSKTFGSRAWVKRHFATHRTIPYSSQGHRKGFLPAYTHPSCWPAVEGFSWERQDAVLANKLRLEVEDAAYETVEDWMVGVAALTKKEYEVKEEIKCLADWWWWWEAQGEDIKQAIEDGEPGPLNIQGDAGDKDIEAQQRRGIVYASGEFPHGRQMLFRAASDKPTSRAPGLRRVRLDDSQVPSSAATVSDATNFFPRVIREHGQSRVSIDLDISGHKPLTVGAVQQFVSECNSKFNGDNGENFATNTRQGQAVMAFLNSLYTKDNSWISNMEFFLQNHRTMQVDPRMSALPVLYVREKLWDGMVDAISDFFDGRDGIPRHTSDEVALTQALVAYANSPGDTAAQEKIQLFANGTDDALNEFYDTKFGPSQR